MENEFQEGNVVTENAENTAAEPKSQLPRGLVRPERPTGTAIRNLHRLSGLSEEEFAQRLNVSLSTLRRWESNRGAMRLRSESVQSLMTLQRTVLKELGYQ